MQSSPHPGERRDHSQIRNRIPHAGTPLPFLSRSAGFEGEARAERATLGAEEHHPDPVVGVGLRERVVEFVSQLDGDGVELVWAAEHERTDRSVVFTAHRGHGRQNM